jgi:hypothetical protein
MNTVAELLSKVGKNNCVLIFKGMLLFFFYSIFNFLFYFYLLLGNQLDKNRTFKSYGIGESSDVYIAPEHFEVTVRLEGNDDIKLEVRELSLLLLFIVIVNKIVLLFT